MHWRIPNLLWKWLEPRIQDIITDRLIAFHAAMLERGEITMGWNILVQPQGKVLQFQATRSSDDECPSVDYKPGSGLTNAPKPM